MHLSRSLVADSHIGLVIDIWITFDFEKVSKTKYVEECRRKQPTYILHNLKLDSEKNGLVIDISCKNLWLTFLKSYKNHVNTRRTYSIPSNTVSSIAQWYSAGFECGKSLVQSPVKDRGIPKTLLKWYQQFPCLALNINKGKYLLFLKS